MDLEKLISQGSPREIRKYISQSESETLEFKKSTGEWKELIKTISAFANTRGGHILIGISDKERVQGIRIGKRTVEDLTNKIKENTDPKIFPGISVKKIERKEVILIKVEESKFKPVFAFNRVYKRVGKSTVRVTSEEIRKMALENKKIYWDEQICEGAKLEDIDEEKVKWYLDRRAEIRMVEKPEKMNLKTLLLNIKAAKEVNGEIKITNAGVLFFTKYPQKFILQSQLRLARFAGRTLTRDFLDRLDCSGALREMVESAEEFIRRNIRLFGFRTEFNFRRIDKMEYPLKALREAIINAIIHRNFEEPADTRVLIFDNRIEIVNPGSFPKGVTPENPRHVPINPILCQLMYDVGFIEKYGTGIYMMKESCKEYGIPEPEYEINDIETKLIFQSSSNAIILSEIEKYGVELNERQRKALKYAFRERYITNKIYVDINKVSSKTASLELKDLMQKKLLEIRGKGRAIKYVPKIR
ncbi:MAG: putative DNA binding domain-containing protein [candidate division WOR-3 bacterium]|nr:putative DNA binding domain-containing protein [candidate division WOR-3 bacterium]